MSIATEISRIQQAKADIKSSIEAKGVTVPSSALIDDYSDYVDAIQTGGGGGGTKIAVSKDVSNYTDGNTFNFLKQITGVNFPSGITSIGYDAFRGCSGMTSVTIPNSVTSIGGSAFYSCTGLTSVTIGNGVTSIGQEVFRYCTALTSITVVATTPPTLGSGAFTSTNNCPIYVPAASVETYKAASGWSTYASRIQAISE